jgi:hypothetical protein
MADNFLCYGDKLDILRRCIKDENIDLVYQERPAGEGVNRWAAGARGVDAAVGRSVNSSAWGGGYGP